MRDEADDVRTWWAGVHPSTEVAARLAEIARVRAQVFLPVVILAIAVSLVVSEPAGCRSLRRSSSSMRPC